MKLVWTFLSFGVEWHHNNNNNDQSLSQWYSGTCILKNTNSVKNDGPYLNSSGNVKNLSLKCYESKIILWTNMCCCWNNIICNVVCIFDVSQWLHCTITQVVKPFTELQQRDDYRLMGKCLLHTGFLPRFLHIDWTSLH